MNTLMTKASVLMIVAMQLISNNGYSQGILRNVSEYNLTMGIGLKGYDPVSYFQAGGGAPRKGDPEIKVEFKGVMYLFSSKSNLNLFLTSPEKYEPTYGGWCAYAMASGAKIDINPEIFTVNGNRLHLFITRRVKQTFDADIWSFEEQADANWKKISGESPR